MTIKPTTGVERLRELYAMLAGIPDQAVNLRSWASSRRSGERASPDVVKRAAQTHAKGNECGTTACAVGWATIYPPFIEQGLFLERTSVHCASEPAYRAAAHVTARGWSAVRQFFGLNDDEADTLFRDAISPSIQVANVRDGEDGLTDRQAVMRRIRRLLLRNGLISEERNEQLAMIEGVRA